MDVPQLNLTASNIQPLWCASPLNEASYITEYMQNRQTKHRLTKDMQIIYAAINSIETLLNVKEKDIMMLEK